MSKTAHKGDWVRIEQIILTPEQRLETLPEATRKVPLKCWTNGFLEEEEASVGEIVHIKTNIGRIISGTLYEIWPKYDHSFGRQQPVLIHVGEEIENLMKEEDQNGKRTDSI